MDPARLQHGAQPREGLISVLLSEFPAYTLETLEQTDMTTLLHVLEARRAALAVSLFRQGSHGRAELAKRPDLMELLVAMGRAQQGGHVTERDVLADLAAAHPDETDQT